MTMLKNSNAFSKWYVFAHDQMLIYVLLTSFIFFRNLRDTFGETSSTVLLLHRFTNKIMLMTIYILSIE